MEPYRYQRKDDKDRDREAGDSKLPAGELKMILGGLMVGRMLKSQKKAHEREINSVHSRLPPIKMPLNEEPDIVLSERDGRDIRQTYDNPLVIMLRVEKFNIHWVLIDNRCSADIIYLPVIQQMKLTREGLGLSPLLW